MQASRCGDRIQTRSQNLRFSSRKPSRHESPSNPHRPPKDSRPKRKHHSQPHDHDIAAFLISSPIHSSSNNPHPRRSNRSALNENRNTNPSFLSWLRQNKARMYMLPTHLIEKRTDSATPVVACYKLTMPCSSGARDSYLPRPEEEVDCVDLNEGFVAATEEKRTCAANTSEKRRRRWLCALPPLQLQQYSVGFFSWHFKFLIISNFSCD